MVKLAQDGWEIVRTDLPHSLLETLRESVFSRHSPGQRCLLDHAAVKQSALLLHSELTRTGFLPEAAVAIQAIAFDKTPEAKWKVTWHQDVMFPFANRVSTPGYDLASVKDRVHYARPPLTVLEELLAVRLHLDDCDSSNGPLRVASGSHREGVLKSTDLADAVMRHKEALCAAKTGEALLMKPLLLHASSPANLPKRRRVLHFVFHSGRHLPEEWYRAL